MAGYRWSPLGIASWGSTAKCLCWWPGTTGWRTHTATRPGSDMQEVPPGAEGLQQAGEEGWQAMTMTLGSDHVQLWGQSNPCTTTGSGRWLQQSVWRRGHGGSRRPTSRAVPLRQWGQQRLGLCPLVRVRLCPSVRRLWACGGSTALRAAALARWSEPKEGHQGRGWEDWLPSAGRRAGEVIMPYLIISFFC